MLDLTTDPYADVGGTTQWLGALERSTFTSSHSFPDLPQLILRTAQDHMQ